MEHQINKSNEGAEVFAENCVENRAENSAAPVIDFNKFRPTRSHIAARKRKDMLMRVLIFLSFVVALIPLISLLLTTIINGIKRLNFDFLTHNMTYVVGGNATGTGGYGGILHAIIGTLEITLGAMVISIPIGLMCAVYLVEYARGNKISRIINLLVDVMSGIPSIVAGLFAFSMFALLAGPGTINGFEGSVALSLLMIPTVVKSSQEMLKIVPNDLRRRLLLWELLSSAQLQKSFCALLFRELCLAVFLRLRALLAKLHHFLWLQALLLPRISIYLMGK